MVPQALNVIEQSNTRSANILIVPDSLDSFARFVPHDIVNNRFGDVFFVFRS